MKKTVKKIVVAKSIGHILTVLMLLIALIGTDLWLIVKSGSLMAGCLLLPLIVVWSFVLLYFCTWKIIFLPKGIEYRRLFALRCYTYLQIEKVVEYLSYTENESIWITFYDGRRIHFTIRNRNFIQGKKALAARCSIRRLTK